MADHDGEDLVLTRGDVTPLPHTLEGIRHLSISLIEADTAAGTATLELTNPEAEADPVVEGLVEEAADDAEDANRWRERLHLPEKSVPIDTSTKPTQTIRCELHERLAIGDYVWTVTDIADAQVTLTSDDGPGLVDRLTRDAAAVDVGEGADAVDKLL